MAQFGELMSVSFQDVRPLVEQRDEAGPHQVGDDEGAGRGTASGRPLAEGVRQQQTDVDIVFSGVSVMAGYSNGVISDRCPWAPGGGRQGPGGGDGWRNRNCQGGVAVVDIAEIVVAASGVYLSVFVSHKAYLASYYMN